MATKTKTAIARRRAAKPVETPPKNPIAEQYPQYYKDVSKLSEIDVYAVNALFRVKDDSGNLQHANKKVLLSGVRTGGKSKRADIKEARDTLTRWLQLYDAGLVE